METTGNGGRSDSRGKEGNRGVTLAKEKVQMQIEIMEGELFMWNGLVLEERRRHRLM